MEPLLRHDRQELEDLATDLVAKASTIAGRLHPVMRGSVGDLVRSMNCHYSNPIEGHNRPSFWDRRCAISAVMVWARQCIRERRLRR